MKKTYTQMRVVSVTDEHWYGVGLIVSSSQKPHFSQRTREMGHPAYLRDGVANGDVGHPPFRHAWESDPDINELRGPDQNVYWHKFYGSKIDRCRIKLAEIAARRLP